MYKIIFTLTLLAAFAPPIVRAQQCPPTGAPVADTLYASNYFPLGIGDSWDYLQRGDGFFGAISRREVVEDTLIDEIRVANVQVINYPHDDGVILREDPDTTMQRFAVVDGLIKEFKDGVFIDTFIELGQPFNACYDGGGNVVEVAGRYDSTYTFFEDAMDPFEEGKEVVYDVPAIKTFLCCSGSLTYGHGIGLLTSYVDPSIVTTLIYARVDGQEFGTRLDMVLPIWTSNESGGTIPDALDIKIFPNPAATSINLRISLPKSGFVALDAFNSLGQHVGTLLKGFFPAGEVQTQWHVEHYPAGLYHVKLTGEYMGTMTASVAITG